MFIIYMYKNRKNNKVYIGQTTRSKKQREGKDGCLYKHSPYFYSAIKKYGIDNFDYYILKENLTFDEANFYEKYYISLYNSTNSEHGYNLTYGGQKFKLVEKTKKKISIGVRNSSKFAKNNRDAHKKSIISIDLSTKEYEYFDAIKDAEIKYGYLHSNIGNCCKIKSRSYKNKIWRYYNDITLPINVDFLIDEYYKYREKSQDIRKENISSSQKVRLSKIAQKYNSKPVLQYSLDNNLIAEFRSIKDAEDKTNIQASSISAVCSNKRKTAGGYVWKYKNLL